ncbi:MAG: hypothetical protein ABI315_08345 [Bacteroidia bacterium]
MKKFYLLFVTIIITTIGCKKYTEDAPQPTPPVTPATIYNHTIILENIVEGSNGTSQSLTNNCFVNLYEGKSYNLKDATDNSDKVDFAYHYHSGGCSNCRFFENIKSMANHSGYVNNFSSITNSGIQNIQALYKVSDAAFDSVSTANDLKALFKRYNINTSIKDSISHITDKMTDFASGKIFGFKDKRGKLGVFKLGNYVANVPTGDKATITLTIKIEK